MGDDDYDDDDHDTVILVPQTELVAIRFWLRYIYIYGFLFRSFRSLAKQATQPKHASKANHY